MSFGNYLLTLFLIIFMSIFFATAAIINQAVIKLAADPNSLPGFSYKNSSAYVTMGIVFGIFAAVIIVLLAIYAFLTKRGSCCNAVDGNGVTGKTPTGVIVSLFAGFAIFAVFSSLFIGNSIFLAKMKSVIASDPAAIAVSPNTVNVFYIINAVLAGISTTITFLALLGFVLALIPQTQRFIFALFGVKPKVPGLKTPSSVPSAKKKTPVPVTGSSTTKLKVDETIEMTGISPSSSPTSYVQSTGVPSVVNTATYKTTTTTAPISPSTVLGDLQSTTNQLFNELVAPNTINTPFGPFPINLS